MSQDAVNENAQGTENENEVDAVETPDAAASPSDDGSEELDADDLFLDEDEEADGVVGADGYLEVGSVAGGDATSAASADDSAAGGGAIVDLQLARIAELEAELEAARAAQQESHERLLRKAADAENAKRRHQKEKDDLTKFAAESVLKDIVPVLDDLERALEHGADSEDASLLQGVDMVRRKFVQALERRGVVGIDAVGKPFDPQYHEAIQQVQDESVPHNTVATAFQKGYLLHDRLLRPALVVVAQGGPPYVAPASDDVAEAGLADDGGSEDNDAAAESDGND